MLNIRGLRASAGDTEILSGVDFAVAAGEVHVLMGQNGSGKSTLAQVIAGSPIYTVSEGSITLDGTELMTLAPDKRARLGLFVSFQQPVAIPGVPIAQFTRVALKERNNDALRPSHVRERLKEALPRVGLSVAVSERDVNAGFSGGEMKRFELAQLLLLGARVAVLDEIDSGLDVDGIKQIAEIILNQRKGGTALLVVTHNPAVLEFIQPDRISVMANGVIVASGGKEIGVQIVEQGYDSFV